jgi:hypothetical protein
LIDLPLTKARKTHEGIKEMSDVEIKELEHKHSEESMENSWKDELIVIVFALPIVVTFLAPIFSEMTLAQAWDNLAKAPEWYTTVINILVLVIFGLKAVVYKVADKLFGTSSSGSSCKYKGK